MTSKGTKPAWEPSPAYIARQKLKIRREKGEAPEPERTESVDENDGEDEEC